MKERPIIFSGPMVRAILEGRKTQTRRVVKLPKRHDHRGEHEILFYCTGSGQYPGGHETYTGDQPPGLKVRYADHTLQTIPSPYGLPGDRLWVKERHRVVAYENGRACVEYEDGSELWLLPTRLPVPVGLKWRSSRFLWRWASRITLEVTGVRVERVQEIAVSPEDMLAEGVAAVTEAAEHLAFEYRELWDSINGKKPGRSWDDNPWVWVVEFRRL